MAQREYNKLFVGGDLSGIQKFLYNITSRHASVSLKGRSAFLSDYLRNVYNQIEGIIEANGGSIDELYCSGGKFYLITENTSVIVQAIEEYTKRAKESLWEEHRGQLSINISYVAFAEEKGKFYVEGHDDEQNTRSGILWKYVNAGFAQQKNQKFKDLLVSHPNRFFGFDKDDMDSKYLIVGKNHKVCALTGIESPDCRSLTKDDFAKEGLTLAEFEDEKDNNTISDKTPVYLPPVIEQIVQGKKLSIQNKTKTFEQYATTSGGANKGMKGDTYLGVLRMDVDGMGKKFIIGFDTLDAYRNFSKRASAFFENDIQNKYLKDYKKFINIIYAGGDDLFIIGRWDKVIEFAKLIHDETVDVFKKDGYEDTFDKEKKWCSISISGGIAIVKPKFPIAKAAEMAGEAEEAAKQGEKNAFNMFGRTISWNSNKNYIVKTKDKTIEYEHEYDYVEKFKDVFVEYISKYNKNYGFSKSILHKIITYSDIADINIEREAKEKPQNYSYMWHMSYYMTRFMDKYKNFENDADKKKLYTFCRSLRDDHLPKNKGRNLQLLAIAARWAELLLKDQEKNF